MGTHSRLVDGLNTYLRCVTSLLLCALLIACDANSTPDRSVLHSDRDGDAVGFVGDTECRDTLAEDAPKRSWTGTTDTRCVDTKLLASKADASPDSQAVLSLLPVMKIGERRYQNGDEIELLINAAEDLHAFCYFQADDGGIYQIFPNVHQPHNRVSAGELLAMPGDSRVTLVADSASAPEKVVCLGHKAFAGDRVANRLSVLSLEKLSYQSFAEVLEEHRLVDGRLTMSRVLVVVKDVVSDGYITRWESIEPAMVSVHASSAVETDAATQSSRLQMGVFKPTRDWRAIFGLAAAVLSVMGHLPYIRDTIKGVTKPYRATWLIWCVLSTITLFSLFFEGASFSLIFVLGQVSVNYIVFGLSLYFGTGRLLYKKDYILLTVAGLGLMLWYLSDSPVYALLISLGISLLAGVATAFKAFKQPYTETLSCWWMCLIASILSMLSVGSLDWVLLAFPIYVFILNSMIVGAITAGRYFSNRAQNTDRSIDLLDTLQWAPARRQGVEQF